MTHGNVEELLQYLEVDRVDQYLFTGNSPARPKRIFGGQVLAQALSAAIRSVEGERIAHSMHAYFLRPGDPAKQIVFEVDPIRDGRSFATRRVTAKQSGKPIFSTSVSFQFEEAGLDHQAPMPDVPAPESLMSDYEFWSEQHRLNPEKYGPPMMHAIERRSVNRRNYDNPQPTEPLLHTWYKVDGTVGDDPARHQILLAFISDFSLLGTALLPHPYTGYDKQIQAASLDHAIWFHRPCKADDFMLYTMDSPNANGGRGFIRGQFFSRDGVLLASTAQEALIRKRD